MKLKDPNYILVWFCFLILIACQTDQEQLYPTRIIELSSDKAKSLASQIEDEVNVEVHDAFELSLWASDSLVSDPIAISVDPNGKIYYTSASRQTNSEFDIRSHPNWMTASISFQSIEDRRAFLRETFAEKNEEGEKFLKDLNEDGTLDWHDLAVEKEQIWVLDDSDGSGVANRAQLYLEDFNEEITDVANGIEYSEGVVYVSVGPDIWRTEDQDGDGIADMRESLSRGYAVHIGFSGHGMSGVKRGPDGRIYWGIGDIGANVIDKTGKQWKYPNRGVIARAETDGTGFEIFCYGVRNTHEFVFDKYGNLISEDNDGDHAGERERLVYLLNGSETGWRINWQYGKYTDPKNNKYKVWMDEKMHVPHWDGQAAYFLPPIINYVNGPTGMVYNPGTALGPEWYEHFFIAEFRGTPANSPIHAFTLKPNGASFELDQTTELVKGLLPTGLDFGPEGALYFGDWIDGWATNDAGRVWKLDVPGGSNSQIRLETKKLIQSNFANESEENLKSHLAHQDMRIRQKAQFEIARRGSDGLAMFTDVLKNSNHQLARIHSMWGIGQLARSDDPHYAVILWEFLKDPDDEIKTQAAKMLGDVKYEKSGPLILPLLSNPSLRVKLHAVEALGRIEEKNAVQPIIETVEKNNDQDLWLRHACMIALGRIDDELAMAALKNHSSKAVRTVAVVALRRMESPMIAVFLHDQDEFIVTEAARAINDDFSIEGAMSDLAEILDDPRFTNEALLRRAINANLRVGKSENLQRLIVYGGLKTAPEVMRAEALHTVLSWDNPSVFDRVDGRYRGEIRREVKPVQEMIEPKLTALLSDKKAAVRTIATKLVAHFNVADHADDLRNMLKVGEESSVRVAALKALSEMNDPGLSEALEMAISDRDEGLRATALQILPKSEIQPDKAVQLFENVLKSGSVVEKQAALGSLGELKVESAAASLDEIFDLLIEGKTESEINLDILEAAENQGNESLQRKLLTYQSSKPADDPVAPFEEALSGGDARKGHDIFYEHAAAQCVRCHTVFEYGGNAGPGLAGVADRLTDRQLLESMVNPSGEYASGYEVVSLKTTNDETLAGIVISEDETVMNLKIGKDIREIQKSEIALRTSLPSSMLPMNLILSKREIRDVVAFLKTLKSES